MDEDSLGFFENIDFQVKSVVATLGQLFKNKGYFLLQHLVTLLAMELYSSKR